MENHETPEHTVKHIFFTAFGIYAAFVLTVLLFVL